MARLLGWPFLVTCNRKVEYRTVVAPEFMVSDQSSRWLAEAAGGAATPAGQAVYREIHGVGDRPLALVFRVVDAVTRHLGEDQEDEPLRDPWGRKVYLIEGLVQEREGSVPEVRSADLDRCHAAVEEVFRSFWAAKEWTTRASERLEEGRGTELADETPLELIRQPPFALGRISTPERPPGRSAPASQPSLGVQTQEPSKGRPLPEPPGEDVPAAAVGSPPAAVVSPASVHFALSALAGPTRELPRRNLPLTGPFQTLRFSRHGRFFVGLAEDKLAMVRLNNAFELLSSSVFGLARMRMAYRAVAFDPYREHICFVAADQPRAATVVHELDLWHIACSRVFRSGDPRGRVNHLAASRNRLDMATEGGLVSLVHEENYLLGSSWRVRHESYLPLKGIDISPTGQLSLGIDEAGALRLYDLGWAGRYSRIAHSSSIVNAVFLSDDLVALTTVRNEVLIWMTDASTAPELIYEHGYPIVSLVADPKSEHGLLASADAGGTIVLWSTGEMQQPQKLQAGGAVSSIGLEPGGGSIVVSLENGQMMSLSLR